MSKPWQYDPAPQWDPTVDYEPGDTVGFKGLAWKRTRGFSAKLRIRPAVGSPCWRKLGKRPKPIAVGNRSRPSGLAE